MIIVISNVVNEVGDASSNSGCDVDEVKIEIHFEKYMCNG